MNRKESGFTLIEMAIVLVIIGLIVASITVGKDTMRTAEYNKVFAKYISPWTQAAYTFFGKTGQVPTACATNATCVTTMLTVGVTLPNRYTYTDESGTNTDVLITSIVDARSTAVADGSAGATARTGGMVATFTTSEAVAKVVDAILDSGVDAATGITGLGIAVGDVQWTVAAANAYTAGGQGTVAGNTANAGLATMTIRLRDITGSGAGT